jgi:peptide deformylase
LIRVYADLENTPEHRELLKNLAIYPDEILSERASDFIDEELENLELINNIQDTMFKVMNYFGGIGLAGPQANVGKRILVVDLCVEEKENPYWHCFDEKKSCNVDQHKIVMINPEILHLSDEVDSCDEGCLSLPGIKVKVKRPISVKVKFLDEKLEEKIFTMSKLLGRCVQHEIDHLNGIMIIDKVSKDIRKIMLDPKLKKLSSMERC